MPVKPVLKNSMGLWDAHLHMIHEHPLFDGLPVHQPLLGIYENLAPTQSMVSQEGEVMVNMVAFDRYPNADDFKRN